MTQQHKAIKPQQSDLQPVYDLLDALQPARLRRNWQRLDRRTRWMLVMSGASLVLVWVALSVTSMMIRHVQATSGDFLFEALRAPYELETRLLPLQPLDEASILAASVGDYVLQLETVQTSRPATTEAAARPDAAVDVQAVPAVASQMVLGQCLLAVPESDTPCASHPGQYLTSGTYAKADGTVIQAAAASFASTDEARQVTKDVHRYASQVGVMGNYVLGISAVDYFYSSSYGVYTFTWSHENWVYSLSSTSFDALENLLAVFPY